MGVGIEFGEISGINEGDWFEGRKEMMSSGFHRKWGSGIDGNGKEGTAAIVLSGGYEDDSDDGDHSIRDKKRVAGTVLRVVRDTELAITIKSLYNHECQICGIAIPTKTGFYAEGAHIKPLGKPHNGDDSLANLLCLCPNHHVMFDKGVISISDDYKVIGVSDEKLKVHTSHKIDLNNLKYHRESHGF